MAAPKSGAKGVELEEVVRSYFWQAGYFVARGLPYRLDGEDITDIDIWLYERPAAATRRRLIVDIKNKKSPKAAERVIWAAGLEKALRVDGALVVTTDRRASTKRLAKSVSVTLLDGEAVGKLLKSEQLRRPDVLTSEEFDTVIRDVDLARGTGAWRDQARQVRTALLDDIGVRSVNTSLSALRAFSFELTSAQPGGKIAQVALRLIYTVAAAAAIGLDYALSEHAFGSHEDRKRAIVSGIRFGNTDDADALQPVRLAIGLARNFAENGKAIARQIEVGFLSAAESVPAEIIADYVARLATSDALFNAGRALEAASTARHLPGFDQLPTDAKALLAVFLDFSQISRQRVATAWGLENVPAARTPSGVDTATPGPLFVPPSFGSGE
jgi:hypothetical protein